MSVVVPFALVLAAAGTQAGAEVIAACRNAHGDDPPAHIACLEDGLRARDAAVAPGPAPPIATPSVTTSPVVPPPMASPAEVAVDAQPPGFGVEQVRARQPVGDASPEKAAVRIASVAYNARGRGTFTMADGQVWRETETTPERHRLPPDREYAARIEPGRFGGYRMYVDGVRWMYKVERLK